MLQPLTIMPAPRMTCRSRKGKEAEERGQCESQAGSPVAGADGAESVHVGAVMVQAGTDSRMQAGCCCGELENSVREGNGRLTDTSTDGAHLLHVQSSTEERRSGWPDAALVGAEVR